jgi:hypothetical protein
MISLLRDAGEDQWADAIRRLADRIRDAIADPACAEAIAREGMALYGGMGSIRDVVLQDSTGALPSNGDFDQHRSSLYESLLRSI